jgi:hypothetical protein
VQPTLTIRSWSRGGQQKRSGREIGYRGSEDFPETGAELRGIGGCYGSSEERRKTSEGLKERTGEAEDREREERNRDMEVREARGGEVHSPETGDARWGDEFSCMEIPSHVC